MADAPPITGTDFVAVGTRDFDAAARFYGNVLGLQLGKRWGSMPAGEFETGNLTIAVMQSDAFGMEFRPHVHPIELRVEDFGAARAELESRGVEFKGETIDSGVCFQAFFEPTPGPRALAERVGRLLERDDFEVLLAGAGAHGLAVLRALMDATLDLARQRGAWAIRRQ